MKLVNEAPVGNLWRRRRRQGEDFEVEREFVPGSAPGSKPARYALRVVLGRRLGNQGAFVFVKNEYAAVLQLRWQIVLILGRPILRRLDDERAPCLLGCPVDRNDTVDVSGPSTLRAPCPAWS